MKKVLVIYHGNCADGFTAAWAARKFFGDTAEYYAATHQAPPPDVLGRDVVIVDFCFPRQILRAMSLVARSILVLDHHKSAAEDLYAEARTGDEHLTVIRMDDPKWIAPLSWDYFQSCVQMDKNENIVRAIVYAYFDMERSGAGVTWDFFNPHIPRPKLVNHVEDRDLWRFALDGTREIQAAVFSYEYTFENWDLLAQLSAQHLKQEGEAIERKHHKDIAELVKVCQRPMKIHGFTVPVASLPYTLTSDAGHLMAEQTFGLFAACYWDTVDGRVFSLRSTDTGMDVSAIAKVYGGGGHAHAAGFKVPRDHELAMA